MDNIDSIIEDVKVLKSGDQIKKRIKAILDLAEYTGDSGYNSSELEIFNVLHRNIDGSIKYLLSARQLKYLGF